MLALLFIALLWATANSGSVDWQKPVPSTDRVSRPQDLAPDEDFALIEVSKKCSVRVVRFSSDQPVVWVPPSSYWVDTSNGRTQLTAADCPRIFVPQHECGVRVYQGQEHHRAAVSSKDETGPNVHKPDYAEFRRIKQTVKPDYAPFPGCFFEASYWGGQGHTYFTLIWKSQTRPPQPKK